MASCNWYKMILSIIDKKYTVSQDEEYPEMYIFSLSMKGWSERGIEDEQKVKKHLISAIQKMNYLGVDYIVMACNTVHSIYDYLQLHTNIPILNLISTCVNHINKIGYNKVGILGTETTNRTGIYKNEFKKIGIDCIEMGLEFEQKIINDVILSVQGGRNGKSENEIMALVINNMKKQGAEAIILGCTELPLTISKKDVDVPIFDPGYILLDKVTELLYENVPCINV